MIQVREMSATRNSRMYKVEDKLMQKRGKYNSPHLNHQTTSKTINRAQDRRESCARKQSLTGGVLLTGSSSPIIKPASTADPSPVHPALLYPSTMIQLREMSATRVNKGKVKTNQIRSKYHAHSHLRKVPTMSTRPRQRRQCQPECQERVEAKPM